MDHVRHDVDVGFVPGDEVSVVPDVLGRFDGHGVLLCENSIITGGCEGVDECSTYVEHARGRMRSVL